MESELEAEMLKSEYLRLAANEILKRAIGEKSISIFTPIAEDAELVRAYIDPSALYEINGEDPTMICIVMRKGQTVETVKIETSLTGSDPVGIIFLKIRKGE